jgi:putative oxidoreductase
MRSDAVKMNHARRAFFCERTIACYSPRTMNGVPGRWERAAPYVLLAIRLAAALLFFQHGAQKLFGFTGTRPPDDLLSQRAIAGLLETVGPALLAAGLFTRTTAFILCGEMAVAYFMSWAPRGFWPISNGGEEAVGFCYLFLWMVAAGPGAFSVDAWLERRPLPRPFDALKRRLTAWEPQFRAVLRIIIGFVFVQHGARKLFGVLAIVGGRRNVPPLAIDGLPPITGVLDLVGGALLMAGLFTRSVSLMLALELCAAYLLIAAPRGPWPIRNGGGEALLEVAILIALAVLGAGAWSLDRWRARRAANALSSSAAPLA